MGGGMFERRRWLQSLSGDGWRVCCLINYILRLTGGGE